MLRHGCENRILPTINPPGETRMDKLEGHMVDIKACLTANERTRVTQLVKIGVTVIGVLAAAVLGFISSGHIYL